tara:strand:- start:941 stop:1123 length:183 start_codon:yes stop_codon:yes gene_type:complete
MRYHTSLTKPENQIIAVFDAVYNEPNSYEPYYHFNGWENKNLSIIKQNDATSSNLRSFTH